MIKDRLALDPQDILKIVCDYYKVDQEKVMGKIRRREYVIPRHVARFLIRFNTDLGLNDVARLMIGSKSKSNDHTTILNSCKVVTNWMETDEDFNYEIQAIQMNIMEFKTKMMEDLKTKLMERKLKALEKSPPPLPEPILVRMETLSPADEVRRKYL